MIQDLSFDNDPNAVLHDGRWCVEVSDLEQWYVPGASIELDQKYLVEVDADATGAGLLRYISGRPLPLTPGSGMTHYEMVISNVDLYDRGNVLVESAEVGGQVWVDHVKVSQVTVRQARAAMDGIWSAMPAFDFSRYRQASRFDNIPQTWNMLAGGQTVRAVMLGDSIINDTCWSQFDVLVDAAYPGAHLDVIPSVRGSTGCWYYQEDNHVQEYVLDHDPDVVFIGGISQRDDVEAIGNVIDQVRAARPDCEFVLLTKAIGYDEVYTDYPANLLPIDPNNDDYRASLMRLAEEKSAAFFDLTAPYGQYVMDSGLGFDFFKRDDVHGNYWGCSLVARILESHLSPLAGDGNGDDVVDDADYTIWADNYGINDAARITGDFNGDGVVDDADYTLWADSYGQTPTTTPEPASLLVLSAGAAWLLRRRK